jgi:tellurite resistance protein TerC
VHRRAGRLLPLAALSMIIERPVFSGCRPSHSLELVLVLPLLLAEIPAAANAVPLRVEPIFWVAFCAGTAVLLALDMFVFHRKAHEPSLRESALWTVFWCSLALVFNGWIWYWAGHLRAVEFFTGYLVEWSLSMDNVFVFVVIFAYFGVPLKYQYRVLFWGILGAIAMRLTFILAASQLLHRFEWIFYLFGAFLIYTGIKLASAHGVEANPDKNPVLRFARRYLRVAKGSHGDKFFVRQDGKLFVTSLFMVLLVIESTDVVFAVDSVPAIFGITREPFIVFTSNVFAIMGLRALYFLLAGVMSLFRYLHYGLSAILVFIGIKMVLHKLWDPPHWQPLLVIITLLVVAIVTSLMAARRERRMILEGRMSPPPGAGK